MRRTLKTEFRAHRARLGQDQTDTAAALDWSRRTVQRVEAGGYGRALGVLDLHKLAIWFGSDVTPAQVLEWAAADMLDDDDFGPGARRALDATAVRCGRSEPV